MPITTGAWGTQEPDKDRFGIGGKGPGGGSTSTGTQDRNSGQPIGVPKGYVADSPRMWTPSPGQSGRVDYDALRYTVPVKPQYFDGDQYRFRNLSPSEIWELQQIMASAGLLTTEFRSKVWDEATADAYAKVLAYANQQGISDKQALMQLAGMGAGGGLRYTIDENGNLVQTGGPGAEPEKQDLAPIHTTDPEALRLVFKQAGLNMTGVAPSPGEVNRMIKTYNQMEVDRQRDFQQKQLAGSGETVVDIPSAESWSQADVLRRQRPAVEEYSALEHLTDALSFLAAPAWGVGGS